MKDSSASLSSDFSSSFCAAAVGAAGALLASSDTGIGVAAAEVWILGFVDVLADGSW